jgi:hypothetical protein
MQLEQSIIKLTTTIKQEYPAIRIYYRNAR